MQEYIGDFRQRRQSGSSVAGKETAVPDESLDELAQMERGFFANAAQLQANERELEALARKTDKLKEELIARHKRKVGHYCGL
ncbi:hypothetical protein Pmar_PMAR017320 [Perkinsus marinus ATCC 50983]|nr:hypothetical protein Pmar_PMAR017320 [Perkinsus marinus ATCC 50983]EER03906.1 hypothetical protein Pmar_PMAR017320 [Perkinsus marinus ATCC 50983]|eukprot:XP_002772090.1 hypothetical protein Pmar_PMAR017320 [Perkinsus marinus ATCC 50983]